MLNKYFNQRTLAVFFLGFSSGLPLALVGSTLEAWFTTAGRSYMEIGLITLVGMPYVLKFLWAPLLDKLTLGSWGLRRGWILWTQLGLMFFLWLMSLGDPAQAPLMIAGIAVCVAFLSATQDVAIDAYRTEILHPDERGLGAAFSICTYRVAMLIASGGALILADYWGWAVVYQVMACLMAFGVLTTLLIKEPPERPAPVQGIAFYFWEPLKELVMRPMGLSMIALVIFYKLGDAFIAKMTTAFLIRHLEFSLTQIGAVSKVGGVIATLTGAFLGGFIMTRISLYRALMLFGLCQAFSNVMFLWLAHRGHDFYAMATTLMIENFCGGLGTAAFLALLMSLCNPRFTAFQFALLSAISALPREFLGPVSGYMVEQYGWTIYFTTTFIASFPGLICLFYLRNIIDRVRPQHVKYNEVMEAS